MLEIGELNAGYGAVSVLHGVNFTLKQGQFLGLLGANNAGKSTIINCLSGVVRPTSGHIRLDGQELTQLAPHRITEMGLIQVPEGRLVFPKMSVMDNLKLGGSTKRAVKQRSGELDKVFELFPRLAERRGQMAGTLSGGEQQMLAIGRGLMGQPRILMLDEPSLGLSPLFCQIIFAALKKLHDDGLTILCVEQNLNLTLAYSTWCVVLERGVIAVEGSGAELRDHPITRRAYLGL
jgi:branched-chain amino acid transport system ATP-binding protein